MVDSPYEDPLEEGAEGLHDYLEQQNAGVQPDSAFQQQPQLQQKPGLKPLQTRQQPLENPANSQTLTRRSFWSGIGKGAQSPTQTTKAADLVKNTGKGADSALQSGGGTVGSVARTMNSAKEIALTGKSNPVGTAVKLAKNAKQIAKDAAVTIRTMSTVQRGAAVAAISFPLIVIILLFSSGMGQYGNKVSRYGENPGEIGTASGDGTVSVGGPFTCEVRSYLDTIAKWESGLGGPDKLGIESYNAKNYGGSYGDAASYTTTMPTGAAFVNTVRGETKIGYNIGRYQMIPAKSGSPGNWKGGDVEEAQTYLNERGGVPAKIQGWDPKSQDLIAFGRWHYRTRSPKNYGKLSMQTLLESGREGFVKTVGIASGEWSSSPIVPGYTHAKPAESHVTLEQYYAYYQKRLAYCKASGNAARQAGAGNVTRATPTNLPAGAVVVPNVREWLRAEENNAAWPAH